MYWLKFYRHISEMEDIELRQFYFTSEMPVLQWVTSRPII